MNRSKEFRIKIANAVLTEIKSRYKTVSNYARAKKINAKILYWFKTGGMPYSYELFFRKEFPNLPIWREIDNAAG